MMDPEIVARWSAWPAALCYTAALACSLFPATAGQQAWFRRLWSGGWLALVVHIVLSLGWVHAWSWTAAYTHTAERTRLATGWDSGAGVWFNVLAAVVWGVDVLALWIVAPGRERIWNVFRSMARVYLAFMMFNAIVVFGSRFAQYTGYLICMGLAALALKSYCRCRGNDPDQA